MSPPHQILTDITSILIIIQLDQYPHVTNAGIQNQVFSSLSTSLTGSASRLTRMARQGDTVAVLKVAGTVIAIGLALWVILGWIF